MTTKTKAKRARFADGELLPRLNEEQWKSVMDCIDGWRAEGMAFPACEAKLRGAEWGLHPEDLLEVGGRYKEHVRELWRGKVGCEEVSLEMDAELRGAMGMDRDALPAGFLGLLCEVMEYLFGAEVLRWEVGWQRCGSRVLRAGDVVEVLPGPPGPGDDWGACAVRITCGRTGRVELLREHRVRSMPRTLPGEMRLERMAFTEVKGGLVELGMRAAVVKYKYWGTRSGIGSLAELGRAAGVTKQAVHARADRLARKHAESTGEDADRHLHGAVPNRGRRGKEIRSQKPEARSA